MKTKARVRLDKSEKFEVVEPINVSRGGLGFQGPPTYALHDIVWVTMHYMPGTTEMEARSMVVRAAKLAGQDACSYGIRFL